MALMGTQNVGEGASGMKPVISPTYQKKLEAQKTCDIIHPSS
jgi:hypothetical protein